MCETMIMDIDKEIDDVRMKLIKLSAETLSEEVAAVQLNNDEQRHLTIFIVYTLLVQTSESRGIYGIF